MTTSIRSIFTLLFIAAVVACFSCIALSGAVSAQHPDLITSLPGAPSVNFNQYSGHLVVNATTNKNLFYWFVESQSNPAKDPLILWTNGGPGCSSLDGLLAEHGPFQPTDDGSKLTLNEFSINKQANVIYWEGPSGVGFSFSNDEKDYITGDNKVAQDNLRGLLQFYEKFPQYRSHPLYISGESYAGRYIPLFVNQIYEFNKQQGASGFKVPLQGYLIGNGCYDIKLDANSIPPYLLQHQIISLGMYNKADVACKGDFYEHQDEPACSDALGDIYEQLDGLNPYYLYDVCPYDPLLLKKDMKAAMTSAPSMRSAAGKLQHPLFTMARRPLQASAGLRTSSAKPAARNDPPAPREPSCIPNAAKVTYLNRADVKKALHVAQPGKKWEICNMYVNSMYKWEYDSMIPFLQKLNPYYRGLHYSGDSDAVVNSFGTVLGIRALNYTIARPWKQWKYNGEVAGFMETYKVPQSGGEYSYVTIKGAGHMVPTDRPAQSLALYQRFVSGQCC